MTAAALAQAAQHTHAAFDALAPDMRQLWQRFPPRPRPSTWLATERSRDELLTQLLTPPFTVGDQGAQQRRRRGLVGVVNWLADQPGTTWQQRWLASGAQALGNADWWRPALPRLQSGSQRRGESVAVTSNYRVCLLLLVCADAICAFPGCDRPARWCQGHHITSWVDGGPTCLSNVVLACGFHHRLLHHGGWTVHITPDGRPEFTPPAWVDPAQRPRRNHYWPRR